MLIGWNSASIIQGRYDLVWPPQTAYIHTWACRTADCSGSRMRDTRLAYVRPTSLSLSFPAGCDTNLLTVAGTRHPPEAHRRLR